MRIAVLFVQLIFGLLFSETLLGQPAQLPICLSDRSWDRCVGTVRASDGGVYVGEFRNGRRAGAGILYGADGAIQFSGRWRDDSPGTPSYLDPHRFPLDSGALVMANRVNDSTSLQTAERLMAQSPVLSGAQSSLAPCAPDGTWSSCIGDSLVAQEGQFVGEFRDGRPLGLGVLYASDGRLRVMGTWREGQLIQPHRLADLSRFPFKGAHGGNAVLPIQATVTAGAPGRVTAIALPESPSRREAEQGGSLKNPPGLSAADTRKPSRPVERRLALVIGNAAYPSSPLRNAVNDSSDMAKALRGSGFTVIEVANATLTQMRAAARRFGDQLAQNDVGLVYYSGHGLEVKGRNYLIPVNADIQREYEVADQAFDANVFLEMMESMARPGAQRVNILIVDACRNNDLPRSWRSASNGLARMDAPGGTFISFATAPGKVAADGQGRNSPYTKNLLAAIRLPDTPIEQVFKAVRRGVMAETNGEQIPWENSSLTGDFYFTVKQ